MTHWLSMPAAQLLSEQGVSEKGKQTKRLTTDTLIIGSGYGAAMAAVTLAIRNKEHNQNEKIWVFERGQEYVPGDFPKAMGDTPGYLSMHRDGKHYGNADALWDVRIGEGVSVVTGSGLGGTSLVNANVALRPDATVLKHWPTPPKADSPWIDQLTSSFEFVEQLLGVNPHPEHQALPKYRALETLAAALGQACKPAPITVSFENKANAVGVQQAACTNCGNCVSGCNSGAKNHLAMNAWPLARDLCVDIYTGATVNTLSKEGDSWIIHTQLTTAPETVFEVRASRVILAAGTLGSTEILQRSKNNIPLSKQLGERFSTNGDALAFGYGQRSSIQGVATTASTSQSLDPVEPKVGPTIVGYTQPVETQSTIRTLAEGAIPYPLARFWGEMIVTQALFRRWTDNPPSAWHHDHPNADPITVSDDLLNHCQTLLCMGQDEGDGKLTLAGDHISPNWSEREKDSDDFYKRLHQQLQDGEKNGGFEGGYYLPSPQWKFFPDEMSGIAEGADLAGGHAITVHPLGGCAMAAEAGDGVVNHFGQVFSGDEGSEVYSNLYVLDGAIIPKPLGVNPMLTIAALSRYLTTLMSHTSSPTKIPHVGKKQWRTPPVAQGYPVKDPSDQRVALGFHERPFGHLSGDGADAIAAAIAENLDADFAGRENVRATLQQEKGMVVTVDINIPDIFEWLAGPSQPRDAQYRVYPNFIHDYTDDTVPNHHLHEPLFCAQGTVRLLALDRPCCQLQRLLRAISALLRFWRYRRDEVWEKVEEWFASTFGKRKKDDDKARGILKTIREYWRVALSFADYRSLDYEFQHRLKNGSMLNFSGSKQLAYAFNGENVWKALINLPFNVTLVTPENHRYLANGRLRVDLINMSRDLAPYQVKTSPDTPTSVMAMAGLGALFARTVLQTHFWSFGAPTYKRFPTKESANQTRLHPPPSEIKYPTKNSPKAASRRTYHGPQIAPKVNDVPLQLTRYTPANGIVKHGPILLIHGFAHSSRVFWTETIATNWVQHLLNEGYDVWLLDHRLSGGLEGAAETDTTMDQIAETDIPWAVKAVHEETEKAVNILAHCIGAGSFAMSVLSGQLQKSGAESYIASAALHAVPPWLVASEANRIRANLASVIRDEVPFDYFDPIPHDDPDLWDIAFDRLANSIHWPEKERERHYADEKHDAYSRTTCNRMTLFYGVEWNHENLNPETHKQLASLVAPGTVELFRHIYYCVMRKRLTNRQGYETYLQKDNLAHYWTFPTLFLHGEKNEVFSHEASRLSAHMLAASRAAAHPQNRCGETPDYAAQRVWFKNIPAFGHMDFLFGQEAKTKVYPYVTDFLASLRNETTFEGDPPEPSFHTTPRSKPRTGPIISRPKCLDDDYVVRIWLECAQYPTWSTTNITFKDKDGTLLDCRWLRSPKNPDDHDPLGQSTFWLGDLRLPKSTFSGELTLQVSTSCAGLPENEFRPLQIDWRECAWLTRTEANVGQPTTLSFLMGSCLYPGSPFEQTLSDKIFDAMRNHIRDHELQCGVDHLILMGDQIYADATADLFDPQDLDERYRDRYRRAFGGPYENKGANAHEIMSCLPTYFALDDHEILNDWKGVSQHPGKDEESYAIARREAWNYQAHHDDVTSAFESHDHPHFWYHFESRGLPFFVFDTRTQRKQKSRYDINALISAKQLAGFDSWLSKLSKPIKENQPLFIVSGSPLGPLTKELSQFPAQAEYYDNLLGYPAFLDAVHSRLTEHGVEKIVWLSGDHHFSCISDTVLSKASKIRVVHIITSGLFAPLPFVNSRPDNYDWGKTTTMRYTDMDLSIESTPHLLTHCSGHFTRINVEHQDSGWHIDVAAYNQEQRILNSMQMLI